MGVTGSQKQSLLKAERPERNFKQHFFHFFMTLSFDDILVRALKKPDSVRGTCAAEMYEPMSTGLI